MRSSLFYWAMAAWAAMTGARLLFQSLRRSSRGSGRQILPAPTEAEALAELLATTRSSTLAREEVQARLCTLAGELALLAGDGHGDEPQKECLQALLAEESALAAYFAERPSRAKAGARKGEARTFLPRTAEVIGLLERQRHSRMGGSP